MPLIYKKVRFLDGMCPLSRPQVAAVFQRAREKGRKAYLVGGSIRDAIDLPENRTRRANLDFDFAIDGDAVEFAREISEKFAGHFVLLDDKFDIARVVLQEGIVLDFAGYSDGIEQDILRRDLTINALMMDGEVSDQVVDNVGGFEDLQANLIRAISEASLIDDPLRLLRVYRFACARAAQIDAATISIVKTHSEKLARVAPERINYELFSLLNYECSEYIHEMGSSGLLEAIFEELKECRRVTSNSYHHLALFDHSVETIPQLEAKFPSLPEFIQMSSRRELIPGISRLAASKVSALLHDIGKPATWQIQEDGRHSFIGHDKVGAEMIRPLAERMRWAKHLTRLVEKLVLWHLRPGQLFHTGEPTQKALNRFYRNVGDDFPELMLITYADFGATMGPGLSGEKREKLENSFDRLLTGYLTYREQIQSMPKLLTGEDVMRELGIGPGVIVGEILQALEEAQEIKEVSDRSQAQAFIRNYYDAKRPVR